MRRREFIAGTAAAAGMSFTKPLYARTDGRVSDAKRLAIFDGSRKPESLTTDADRGLKAYFDELNKLGYTEGRNLIVERYSALGQFDRFGNVAREIVASHPDIIFPLHIKIIKPINALTTSIPIVGPTPDPVAFGFTTNLGRPDGNFTGVVIDAGLEIWGKRFQLLSESAQKLTKVRYLTGTPVTPGSGELAASQQVREAAQRAGILVIATNVGEKIDQAGYERAFDTMDNDQVDGLLISDNSVHFANRQLITGLAARHHLPAIYPYREFVEVGGLVSYGIDIADMGRRLADMTSQILRGAKPGDIPFYRQTKYELALNRTAATTRGLEFPATLLAVADEVVD